MATTALLTLDDVLAAREAIAGRLHRTPVFGSRTLSELAGARVFLKAELFQRTGSFKPRGVLTRLAHLSEEEKRRGVISISAGNHAQAVAYGCALENVDALVVMWRGASPPKIAATRAYGATIDTEAGDTAEAFARLAELTEETGRTLIHPHEDPDVMAGHGTLGLEIVEDVPKAEAVLVPVGGGGLISGVATAIKGLRPEARVIAVEPERSCALNAGLAAGQAVTVEAASAADGLNVPRAGANAVRVCAEAGVESVLVSEDELGAAFRFLYERAKLACELAGAAATAALLSGRVELEPGSTVVSVVSGGNVAPEIASAILASQ